MCARQLDHLSWGNLAVTRFTSHQVWEGILPHYLVLRTANKGDGHSDRKHLAGILHDRDPMQCAISMLGLYMAYQLFDKDDVRASSLLSLVCVLLIVCTSLSCRACRPWKTG